MRHPHFTASGQVRELGGFDIGDGHEPEMFMTDPCDIDYEDDIDDGLDGLTIVDFPHITGCGSLVEQRV